ncbi:hypothetical protein Stsp02_39420 [Streptomyces sp. NBRC 14336]|uniref:hypothetical protein n=1 Tax=Streptomyces sp. NBRC 14336 TaxID=3030992 RepID=UPI0024A4BA9B|nr:hypothetical protein Stsp02_39420 [Streptomyces sp. NBRC 14336]
MSGALSVALGLGLVVALPSAASTAAPAAKPPQTSEQGADTEVLSEADALAKAKRTGKNVEIVSLRGESSEVYATPDGKLEAREHLRPVRTRVDGAWKAIDTDLARRADGTVAPGAATVGLEFSGGGDQPLVRMERAGRELALTWPTKLPAPELDGAFATYRDVLPDVDLRMGAQQDGFTQLLVVKSAAAAASPELRELRLKLSAQDLDVRETANGGLEAVDEGAGSTVFEAPRPVMWDSSPGRSEAAAAKPADATKRAKTTAAAQGTPKAAPSGGSGGGTEAAESGNVAPIGVELPAHGRELVLKPNKELLTGPDTEYPVYIDPQWHSPKRTAWTMVSKYWASSPQWKFNGESTAGLGYCGWHYCQPYDTKRLFYRVPVSKFAGRSILSAEFGAQHLVGVVLGPRGAAVAHQGHQLLDDLELPEQLGLLDRPPQDGELRLRLRRLRRQGRGVRRALRRPAGRQRQVVHDDLRPAGVQRDGRVRLEAVLGRRVPAGQVQPPAAPGEDVAADHGVRRHLQEARVRRPGALAGQDLRQQRHRPRRRQRRRPVPGQVGLR